MANKNKDICFMCEYPIVGVISDISKLSIGYIFVRPCYFKAGVDKEIAIFLRDAKKERWATKGNLKVGVKLTFKIALDPLKGPKAVELHTITEAPTNAFKEPWRPECIPDARGFNRIIAKARIRDKEVCRDQMSKSSDPIDRLLWAIGL